MRSKKFAQLLKKQGLDEAPAPLRVAKRAPRAEEKEPAAAAGGSAMQVDDGASDNGSEWETASDEDMADEWDVCVSLFDNHRSESLEANLEYMLKRFGFFLPDADYLEDPEGLLKYLGWKVAVAHLPLYKSGLDEGDVKTFRSKRATQQHMVDSCRCTMLFDDNEDEYEEYYDYSKQAEGEGASGGAQSAPEGSQLVVLGGDRPPVVFHEGSGELTLARSGKILGSRSMRQLYRQKHRPEDTRDAVRINEWHSRYRALLSSNLGAGLVPALQAKQEQRVREHRNKHWDYQTKAMAAKGVMNGNKNLLRNVPY